METVTAYGQPLTEAEIALLAEANDMYAQVDAMRGPDANLYALEALAKRAGNKIHEATRRAYYLSFASKDQPHICEPARAAIAEAEGNS